MNADPKQSKLHFHYYIILFFRIVHPRCASDFISQLTTTISMSDSKLFGKSKSLELRAELEQARKKLKPQARVKTVLRKVIANIILNNNELVNLMKDVIHLMSIDDVEIRRLCSHYIINYAALDVEELVTALIFYERFADDHNPALRALAIKTVTSINVKEFVQLGFVLVKRLLSDSNARVRTTAAFSVARLFQYDQEKTSQHGLIDDLNELLYDETQSVVANALAALNSITELANTLNLAIDKNHSLMLIRSLGSANEWRQVYFLNALTSFVPQTSDEALDLIEATLPSLLHENSAVVLNATKVIVYLSNYARNPELALPNLAKRLGSSLVSLLIKPAEIQFVVLRNVILLLLSKRYLLDVDVELFFWKFDDPIYVKDTKLEIIYLLANEQNASVVFRELEEYATEVDVNMARKAIRAFGNLAVKLEITAEQCVDILMDLLSNGIPYIVQEAVVVLKNVLRRYPGRFDFVIEHIVRHYKLMEEPDAKTAINWIVGQFPEQIPNAEQVLSYFIQTFSEEPLEVQYATITAVVKYYVKFPVNGEPLLLKVLKWATEESDNPDIRDRGFFYWRMITDPENNGLDADFQKKTKEIVINVTPLINAENNNVDPTILEELELNIGSLVSIYLKSVEHVFRLAKRKQLPFSPALQEKKENLPPPPSKPVPEPRRDYQHKPLPPIQRKASSGSSLSNTSSPRPLDDETGKKMSFGQLLSHKASQIAGRKNSQF